LESRMISARGIEYSKRSSKPILRSIKKVSAANPGVEYNKMASSPDVPSS
jgi:hypothetical protein